MHFRHLLILLFAQLAILNVQVTTIAVTVKFSSMHCTHSCAKLLALVRKF